MDVEDELEDLKKIVELRKSKTNGEIKHDTCIVGTKELGNLLSAYEELKKENKELRKPKYIIDLKTNKITKLTNDCISRDKIKELKEIIHKELDKNGFTRAYQLIIDEKFNEILQEKE